MSYNNNYYANTSNHNGGFAMKNNKFDNLDVNNSAPRCPVILLLDTSSSMAGMPINELNAGLRQFIEEASQDEAASMSVELEIITFDDSATIVQPFTPMSDFTSVPTLYANGMTYMGAALQLANSELTKRRQLYQRNGIPAYKPWVILMTDGGPNDYWQKAAAEMRHRGENGEIMYIGLEIGGQADHQTMCQIMPLNSPPQQLSCVKFKSFFKWVTDSLKVVTRSAVSAQDAIRLPNPQSWLDFSGM